MKDFEIRFKQIAVTYGESRMLYGLTQDGRVFFHDNDSNQIDWKSLGMRVEEYSGNTKEE